MEKNRCSWANEPEIMRKYHDEEWGRPLFDDRKLFEFLLLDAFQAGLSWLTILKKRENFKQAFDDFDYLKIAEYDEDKIDKLMQDKEIVRNRRKILASIKNAQLYQSIQKEFGSFSDYIWKFVDNAPIVNIWQNWEEIPATTKESDAMSKDLKKRGFSFVGSTIIYAFMQAAGLVDDHVEKCFCKTKLEGK
ncbi:MAG: DNA-3-methyladenine glycosylase I [Candidatus Cloacimonetes bacterium]|nr:DNA-3-methyladenine glycosylase I [Candidatus Cloacimonadota bacterium]